MVTDVRLQEVLHMLAPEPGDRLWHGGPTPLGSLRGVSHELAAWRPTPDRHSIWELTLHIAYWKYAVRRRVEGSKSGGFPRSPANWPAMPATITAASWKRDRLLLRLEQEKLVAAAAHIEPERLDEDAPGGAAYRYLDLLHGVVMHDAYHVGQIQLQKRLYRVRHDGAR